MAKRGYRQTCAAAGALDILGERWTLLIVRELLTGAKRYNDLLENLPGIGTNLLAARLRSLAASGVVRRRRLPPPAGVTVYELTEAGRELESSLIELVRWGLKNQRPPARDAAYRPLWSILAMKAVFQSERAAGASIACEFRVGEHVFHARAADGRLTTAVGPAEKPDVVVITDAGSYRQLESGEELAKLERTGRLSVRGDREAFRRFQSFFVLPVRGAGPRERVARRRSGRSKTARKR